MYLDVILYVRKQQGVSYLGTLACKHLQGITEVKARMIRVNSS